MSKSNSSAAQMCRRDEQKSINNWPTTIDTDTEALISA